MIVKDEKLNTKDGVKSPNKKLIDFEKALTEQLSKSSQVLKNTVTASNKVADKSNDAFTQFENLLAENRKANEEENKRKEAEAKRKKEQYYAQRDKIFENSVKDFNDFGNYIGKNAEKLLVKVPEKVGIGFGTVVTDAVDILAEKNNEVMKELALDQDTYYNAYNSKLETAEEHRQKIDDESKKLANYYENKFDINNENNLSNKLRKKSDELSNEIYSDASEFGKFFYQVEESTINFFGHYLLATVTGGGNALIMTTMGLQSGISKTHENLEKGYDIETSLGNGILTGILSGLTEKIGLDSLAKNVISKTAGQFLLAGIATQMLSEGGEEAIEYVGDWVLDSAFGMNPDFSLQELATNFAMGAVSGGVIAGTFDASNALKTKRQVNQIKANVKTLEQFKNSNTLTDEELIAINGAIQTANTAVNDYYKKSVVGDKVEFQKDIVEPLNARQVQDNLYRFLQPNVDAETKQRINAQNTAYDLVNKSQDFLSRNGIKMNAIQYASLNQEARNNVKTVQNYANDLDLKLSFDTDIDSNGYFNTKTGEMVINPNSKDGPLTVFTHELTHRSELSKHYQELQRLVTSELTDNQIQEKLNKIQDIYKQKGINLDEDNALKEMVAYELQEQLGNEKFANRLVNYNGSLAIRLYEDIKNIVSNTNTAQDIEYNFLKAFRDAKIDTSNIKVAGDLVYSTDSNFEDAVESISNGTFKSTMNAVKVGNNSPKWMTDLGYNDYPMLMTENHIKNGMGIGTKGNQHNISKETFKQLPKLLEDPIGVFKYNNDSIVALVKAIDNDNRVMLVAIKPDGKGKYNNVDIDSNFILSTYGRNALISYYDKKLDGNLIYPAGKTKKDIITEALWLQLPKKQSIESSRLQLPGTSDNRYLYDNNISNNETNVNKNSFDLDYDEKKNLLARHNLSEDKLRKALDLGGFAMPSIAVSKDSINHDGFGDITLVFDKNTIDPSTNDNNKVYSRDAWTPTFPSIEFKVNDEESSNLYKQMRDIQKKYNIGNSVSFDPQNIEYSLNNNKIDNLIDDELLKLAYLDEKGIEVTFPKKKQESQYTTIQNNLSEEEIYTLAKGYFEENAEAKEIAKKVSSIYAEIYLDRLNNLPENTPNHRRRIIENNYQKYINPSEHTLLSIMNEARATQETIEANKNGGIVDEASAKAKIDSLLDENYYKWADKKINDLIEDKGISNGVDPYTNNGNRRSFKATHDAYNLDSIVANMKKQAQTAKGGFGSGLTNLLAATSKEFNSISEIHQAEKYLSSEEPRFNELNDQYNLLRDEIISKWKFNHADSWSAYDNFSDVSSKIAKMDKLNPTKIKREFIKNDYLINDDLANKFFDILNEGRELTTDYFEAKPQRAVRFDEVKQAYYPKGTSQDIINRLNEFGVETIEYDPINENRNQMINERAKDYKFSIDLNNQVPNSSILDTNYTQEEKAKGKQDRDYYADEMSIEDFIESFKGNKNHKVLWLGKINQELIDRVYDDAGVDLSDKSLTIGSEDITHIFKEHDVNNYKIKANSDYINADDLNNLANILNNYDRVEYVKDNYNKEYKLVFETDRSDNGTYRIVELTPTRGKEVRLKTLYVIKKEANRVPNTVNNTTLDSTSTDNGNGSLDASKNNISNKSSNVKSNQTLDYIEDQYNIKDERMNELYNRMIDEIKDDGFVYNDTYEEIVDYIVENAKVENINPLKEDAKKFFKNRTFYLPSKYSRDISGENMFITNQTLPNGMKLTKNVNAESLDSALHEFESKHPEIGNSWGIDETDRLNSLLNMLRSDDYVSSKQINGEELLRQDAISDLNRFIDDIYFKNDIQKYNDSLKEYGSIKQGESPKTEFEAPKQTDVNTKTRQFVRTIGESNVMDNEALKAEIGKGTFAYRPESNKRLVERAKKELDGLSKEDALYKFYTSENNSSRIAKGEVLLNYLGSIGDTDNAIKVASELATQLTEASKTTQASRILKRLTPEGRLVTLEQNINKIQNILDINHGDKAIEIEVPTELKEKVLNSKNETELNEALEEISKNVAEQIPSTLKDKLDTWRYLSMLGSHRTHIRNIVGNAMFKPVVDIKNYVGTAIESFAQKQGYIDTRTKSLLHNKINANDKALYDFAKADYDNFAKNVIQENGKYDISELVQKYKKAFKDKGIGKWINEVAEFNGKLLDAEDILFSKARYAKSLAQFMKANNITENDVNTELFQKGQDYAMQEALRATYRDDNWMANGLNRLGNRNKVARFFLDAVLPFKKTPLNIVRRGIEYSPANLLYTVTKRAGDLKNGKINANEYIDSLSQGLTGTGIALLGAYLASKGILKITDDDKDRKNRYDSELGEQTYSIQFPFGSYTIDWASPVVMPMAVGAELWRQVFQESDADLGDRALDMITSVAEPIFETSMLSGVMNFINTYGVADSEKFFGMIFNAISSYALQYVPTALGQTARIVDGTQRATYPNKGAVDKFKRQLYNKIPWLSMLNQPSINSKGEETQREDLGMGALGRFLLESSPGYYKSNKSDEFSDELMRLYEETGEDNVLPTNSTTQFSYDGEKYKLYDEEFTNFQKTKNKLGYDYVKEFMNSMGYSSLSDSEKADIISDIRDYATKQAKSEFLDMQGVSFEDTGLGKINGALDNDVNLYDYFNAKNNFDELSGEDKKNDYLSYLEDSDLSASGKNYMYDVQYGDSKFANSINDFANDYNVDDKTTFKIKKTSAIESLKDNDGNTISNSKALQVRKELEDLGQYDNLIDYLSENGLKPSDIGLTKKVASMSDNEFMNEYEAMFSGRVITDTPSTKRTRSNTSKKQTQAMLKKIKNISDDTYAQINNILERFVYNKNSVNSSEVKVEFQKAGLTEITQKYLKENPYVDKSMFGL